MNISMYYNYKFECFESPFFSKHVKVIGDDLNSNMSIFLKYAGDIISGRSTQYQDRFKFWLIIPFMINIQHIYAYYNYDNYLKFAFISDVPYQGGKVSIGDASFVESANKYTPLSVSVHQNYIDCAQICLKAIRKRWYKDPYSLIFVGNTITALNKMGIDKLHKIYNFTLQKSFLKTLPIFCNLTNLPIVFRSNLLKSTTWQCLEQKLIHLMVLP